MHHFCTFLDLPINSGPRLWNISGGQSPTDHDRSTMFLICTCTTTTHILRVFLISAVELKVPIIEKRRAKLLVVTSNSSKWSNYSIQLTNSYKTITLNFSRAVNPDNDTTVPLSPLDPGTVYVVRVTPVQDDGEEMPEWSNEVSFKTRKLCLSLPQLLVVKIKDRDCIYRLVSI